MVAVSVGLNWTAQDLTIALGGRWNGKSGKARCPLHDDRTPSMSITTGTKQEIVVHCFVCDQAAIVEHLRGHNLLPPKDNGPWAPPVLHVDTNGHADDDDLPNFPQAVTPINKEIATYSYHDADGALVFEKLRYEPKTFRIRDAAGRWGLNGAEPVLYRLPEMLRATGDAPVYVVEGEKDADRLISLGLTATTNYDGADGLWRESYNAALAGRDVVIIPDNDAPGEKHAETVRAALTGVARTVRIIHLGGVPEKGDVSDWLDMGGTTDQLALLARETFPHRFRLRTVDDILNMPPPEFLANGWLVKGTLSELYGPSGVGKSFIVLDLLLSIASGSAEWLGSIPVVHGPVVYIIAEGVGGLQKRIRAWLSTHPDADLSLMRFVTVPVNMLESPEVSDLLESIRAQCLDTPIIVAIDTLARSMAGGDENSTKDMSAVVVAADRVRVTLDCHVMIVHHTGKNGEDDRGSTALRGACDTMIKVTREDGAIKVHSFKQKDIADPPDIGLKLVPVDGTESCVIELFDQSGQLTTSARRLLSVLHDCFPLNEGASTTAWLKASGLPDNTFYASRRLLLSNKCVACDKRGAPNIITTLGCRDLGIEPDSTTPEATTDYYRLLPTVVEATPTTTTTVAPPLGGHGSSSKGAWWVGAE